MLIKVFDKQTDKLKRTKICENKKEYRNYLCNEVNHSTETAFGIKIK
jgi:hypothetical protein